MGGTEASRNRSPEIVEGKIEPAQSLRDQFVSNIFLRLKKDGCFGTSSEGLHETSKDFYVSFKENEQLIFTTF